MGEPTGVYFMCGVDFQHHLDNDALGTPVYASIEDLREHRHCVKQCGIVAVKIELVRWEQEQDFSRENMEEQ